MNRPLFFEAGLGAPLEFKDIFRSLRMSRDISARALSLACGLSASYVSKIESGDTTPSVETFAKLIYELNCSEPEILYMLGRLARS